MRKRILAFCTACIICVSFCLYSVAPVRVSASGGGVTALYDLYQLYLLLMGISTSSSNSDYGFDDYWHDNFEHKNYYEEWDSDLTDYEAGWYTIFDTIHLDDLVTNIDKLVASWDETYDTVGSVGSGSVSPIIGSLSDDGCCYCITSGSYHSTSDSYYLFQNANLSNYGNNCYLMIGGIYGSSPTIYFVRLSDGYFYTICNPIDYNIRFSLGGKDIGSITLTKDRRTYTSASGTVYTYDSFSGYDDRIFDFFNYYGVDLSVSTYSSINSFIDDLSLFSFAPLSDFVGPVYSYPAAEQLAKDNNTVSGIRLAVDTDTGVADLNAVLDRTGCDDMDDVVSGVAAGSIPMSDVFDAAGVTPYILTDVDTGEVITDMGVSASAEGVKPVALTSELAVPADLAAAEALSIPGRTFDPDTSKYKLPLFNFFPFCLPWDIYKVLSSFDADPVAPVFDIPLGNFFARAQGGDATASYVATVDLGDEHYAKWFSLLRSLECIGIIVGFVLLARALIHGGD